MPNVTHPLRRLSVKHPLAAELEGLPNFGPRGNLTGMRLHWQSWRESMPVKCSRYVYDCRHAPHIYEAAK